MPTKKEQILHKISKIKNYLRELSAFRDSPLEELKNDSHGKAALERFLYLMCDSVISLLEMMIAFKDYPSATTYSENIDILLDQKEISENDVQLLHKIVGLRNILSHDYEKLDFAILKEIIDGELSGVENLLDRFKNKLD